MKIGILEPDFFSEQGIEKLSRIGDIKFFQSTSNLEEFLNEVEILFIRLKYQIDKDFLKKCKNLRILCSPTTGLNHIDENALKEKGVKLISLKDKTSHLGEVRATPENTIGLALALIRGYHKIFLNQNNSNWDRYKYYGEELSNMKIGIIGFGRVGKQLSKYLKAFSSNVFAYDIKKIQSDSTITISNTIKDLIENCQMIFLTASYSNEIIINKNHINLLKDKFFINTSRGELIDEDYFIEKLNDSFFRGVALDVITNENSTANNLNHYLKAVDNQNVIITPHVSGVTKSSLNMTEDILITALFQYMKPYF